MVSGETWHPSPQAAQATHAEYDGDAGLARFVQLANNFWVLQLIQLDADTARPTRPLMVRFPADQRGEAFAHVVRSHE